MSAPSIRSRPHVIAVLAMSADGKIADVRRSAARFPSSADKAHLERQVALADATLFGAGTLRAYGTTLPVTSTDLLAARQQRGQSAQPIQIVCSATGKLNPCWRFFQQPIPRWLITTPAGQSTWQKIASECEGDSFFEKQIVADAPLNWSELMAGWSSHHWSSIERLLVMGGGELIASLLREQLIDELYLTICPLLIGGKTAPTPVGGSGFTLPEVPTLQLRSVRTEGHEVFLHYFVGDIGFS